MKVILKDETTLDLTGLDTPDMEIEAEGHVHWGPMQMFITSMALCTYAVVEVYGRILGVDPATMRIAMAWEYRDAPYRIGAIDMDIHWPGVPEDRLRAVEKAASRCTIHNTLHHPPEVVTRVHGED